MENTEFELTPEERREMALFVGTELTVDEILEDFTPEQILGRFTPEQIKAYLEKIGVSLSYPEQDSRNVRKLCTEMFPEILKEDTGMENTEFELTPEERKRMALFVVSELTPEQIMTELTSEAGLTPEQILERILPEQIITYLEKIGERLS